MKIELVKTIAALFEKIDKKNRYYILIGILVLIFLINYFIFMRPQLTDLPKIGPERKILTEDLKNAKEDIQKKDQYKTQVQQLKEGINRANQWVMAREDAPLILEKLSSIANKNGIKIDQMTPKSEDQKKLLEKGDLKYFSFPIQMEAKGSYHNFGRFLNTLEHEEVFLLVKGFTMSANKEDPRNHNISLTLDSIVFEKK